MIQTAVALFETYALQPVQTIPNRPAPASAPTLSKNVSEAIAIAARDGVSFIGRACIRCDTCTTAQDRYAVWADGDMLTGPVTARQTHAIVSALLTI